MGQDVIVLRESGEEIRCRIVEITDSEISYRKWRSEDDTVYRLDRFDVLSYTVNKNQNLKKRRSDEPAPNENLLAKYRSGELRPGYIISKTGDTIEGTVEVRNLAYNQLLLNWKSENGDSAIYKPDDLIGYGYDRIHYRSQHIEFKGDITTGSKSEGQLFLELLDDGPAKLFKLIQLTFPKSVVRQFDDPAVYYGTLEVHYYIIPPKGKSRVIKSQSPRNNLIRCFEDHKLLVEDMIENKPLKSEVPQIVAKYNYWYENLETPGHE